jgi:hypothetical protein
MAQDQPSIGGKMMIGSGMVVFPFLAALEAANREGRRQAAPLSFSGSNVQARRSHQGGAML